MAYTQLNHPNAIIHNGREFVATGKSAQRFNDGCVGWEYGCAYTIGKKKAIHVDEKIWLYEDESRNFD